MDRWLGKVAVVTGASAGIGAAITVDLAKAGMIVIGLARRPERVDQLSDQLPPSATKTGAIHSYKCDVAEELEIVAAFAWITEKFGGVDVLINNAGIVRDTKLIAPNNSADIRAVVQTNIMGVVWCTREAFASMKARNVAGHIVLINSTLGHFIPPVSGSAANIYPCTKFAVTAMTEVLRQELWAEGTKVKVTSISPGLVRTEIVPAEFYALYPALEAADISAGVLYVLGTPPRVQVRELTLQPMGEE